MRQTDDPVVLLGVLNNILKNGVTLDEHNKMRYLLGELTGISKLMELRILKDLHNKKILSVESYLRSNGSSYDIEDDFTQTLRMNPSYRFITDAPSSRMIVTEPISVTLIYDKKKIRKKIALLKREPLSINSSRILWKDEKGDFIFNGKKLKTRDQPLSKEVKHYKILDILLEYGDQEGRVPARKVIEELKKRGVWEEKPDEWIIKRIRDTIDGGLFGKVRAGGSLFKNKLPNDGKVIETYKSKDASFGGWKINNPPMN